MESIKAFRGTLIDVSVRSSIRNGFERVDSITMRSIRACRLISHSAIASLSSMHVASLRNQLALQRFTSTAADLPTALQKKTDIVSAPIALEDATSGVSSQVLLDFT